MTVPRVAVSLLAFTVSLLMLPVIVGAAPEPRLGGVEAAMRLDLDRNAVALSANPSDMTLRHERLRLLHALSIEEASLLDSARIELEVLSREVPESRSLWTAYAGALHVVEARHASWPHERAQFLRRGLAMLDSAVNEKGDDVEIRHLRLVSGYYLPAVLGRRGEVREDFGVLARLLPAAQPEYPGLWFVTTTDFVLEHGSLGRTTRKRLLEARQKAASGKESLLPAVPGID